MHFNPHYGLEESRRENIQISKWQTALRAPRASQQSMCVFCLKNLLITTLHGDANTSTGARRALGHPYCWFLRYIASVLWARTWRSSLSVPTVSDLLRVSLGWLGRENTVLLLMFVKAPGKFRYFVVRNIWAGRRRGIITIITYLKYSQDKWDS